MRKSQAFNGINWQWKINNNWYWEESSSNGYYSEIAAFGIAVVFSENGELVTQTIVEVSFQLCHKWRVNIRENDWDVFTFQSRKYHSFHHGI